MLQESYIVFSVCLKDKVIVGSDNVWLLGLYFFKSHLLRKWLSLYIVGYKKTCF